MGCGLVGLRQMSGHPSRRHQGNSQSADIRMSHPSPVGLPSSLPNASLDSSKSKPASTIESLMSCFSKSHRKMLDSSEAARSAMPQSASQGSSSYSSQQVLENVQGGHRIRRGHPNGASGSATTQSNPGPAEEYNARNACHYSEKDIRVIDSGLLSMKVIYSDISPLEINQYEKCSQKVKILEGESKLESLLPLYAAQHCRPDATNPTKLIYYEIQAFPEWSEKGAISVGFSIPGYVGLVGSKPRSVAIRGGNLYHGGDPLGSQQASPFTSGRIGIGLVLKYTKAASTTTTSAIDVAVFHTRDGELVESFKLGRGTAGFDGCHDLFVDVQTVDEVEFEVVFERKWWTCKSLDQVLAGGCCGM